MQRVLKTLPFPLPTPAELIGIICIALLFAWTVGLGRNSIPVFYAVSHPIAAAMLTYLVRRCSDDGLDAVKRWSDTAWNGVALLGVAALAAKASGQPDIVELLRPLPIAIYVGFAGFVAIVRFAVQAQITFRKEWKSKGEGSQPASGSADAIWYARARPLLPWFTSSEHHHLQNK